MFFVKTCLILIKLEDNHYFLELFHGPTLAFKDFAMQVIAKMFARTLQKKNSEIKIIWTLLTKYIKWVASILKLILIATQYGLHKLWQYGVLDHKK